ELVFDIPRRNNDSNRHCHRSVERAQKTEKKGAKEYVCYHRIEDLDHATAIRKRGQPTNRDSQRVRHGKEPALEERRVSISGVADKMPMPKYQREDHQPRQNGRPQRKSGACAAAKEKKLTPAPC